MRVCGTVSQDFILQGVRIPRRTQVSSNPMQTESLRYSRTGVLRYAFGGSSADTG